ncbi:MAG: hypothetical protein IAG13_21235, partial [Deltaproteobacteria bacterium]|nr:hypothetical protein [Nannocystaceae bacterium]
MFARLLVGAVTSFTLAWPTPVLVLAPSGAPIDAPLEPPRSSEVPPAEPSPTETPPPAPPTTTELPAGFDRCERTSAAQRFRITLPKEAELVDLVNWMSSVSCQKFIWDPAVRGGKVSVLAPESVSLR